MPDSLFQCCLSYLRFSNPSFFAACVISLFPVDNISCITMIIHAFADDDDGFDDDFDKIADSSVSSYNLAILVVIAVLCLWEL